MKIDETILVSVIVPVYNMESTLSRCLDSIIEQDYKYIEVILINDGSKDKSPEICDRYAKKYNNIKYYSRENRGLSYTLKEGIDLSTGDFLIFVDSDDYVEPNLVSVLLSAQQKSNADVVQSGISYMRVDGSQKGQLKLKGTIILDKNTLFRAYFINKTTNRTLASALFRKFLFNDINFPQDALSIDIQVMPFVLAKCNVFKQIEEVLYNAVQYPNSVSRREVTDKIYNDKMKCNLILESFFDKYAPQLKEYIHYRRLSVSSYLYSEIVSGRNEGITDKKTKLTSCKQMFSNNYKPFVASNLYLQYNKKDRIKFKIFSISPHLYMCIMGLYEKWMSRDTNN